MSANFLLIKRQDNIWMNTKGIIGIGRFYLDKNDDGSVTVHRLSGSGELSWTDSRTIADDGVYGVTVMCDDDIECESSDIVFHYFSTELVLMAVERLIEKPPADRSDDIKAFRQTFHKAVNGNYDLAGTFGTCARPFEGGGNHDH